MDPYAHVTAPAPRAKGRGFFATVAMGLFGVLGTAIVCGSGITLYGMHIFDRKTGSLVELVQESVKSLPELQKNLPPILADAVNDERRADYVGKVVATARLDGSADRRGWVRPTIEIKNTGDELVSLVSMRVVVTDDAGRPVATHHCWAATPMTLCEREWPGPLMPGATRKMAEQVFIGGRDRGEGSPVYKVECEVTDVRVWKPRTAVSAPENGASAQRSEPGGATVVRAESNDD